MSQLLDLYQELIVDHSKNPRNKGRLDDCSYSAEGYNPLCGDRIHIYLKVDENDVIRDVKFEGSGCAISTASASIMSQTLKGQTRKQAEVLFETFHYMLTGPKDPGHHAPQLGKLAVFAGVHEFPMRVKCASLAWHTMKAALEGGARATTE